jgi:ferritin-like metal-binding protein YciE
MARDLLVSWLNDAYAMEQALIPVLRNHAKDAEGNTPDAAARLRQHVDQTETHLRRLEQCLLALGASPSTLKSTTGSVMGTVQSVMSGMFSDEMIKNTISDYGSEQFEVASYTALVAAADELGLEDVARLCEENLREDQLMASWLEQQIPVVVARSVARQISASPRT